MQRVMSTILHSIYFRDFEAWQFAMRDYFSMVFSYFEVALFAQNYAVASSQSSAFCYWYAGDGIAFTRPNVFAAFSTPRPRPIISVLPNLSSISSVVGEHHSVLPLSFNWHKDSFNDVYWYYSNGKWTGIIISTISRLRVPTNICRYISLKHPSYRITFCPYGDTTRLCHLVETPTLSEAKEIAEQYYREWDVINQNLGEPLKVCPYL
jgi:hypothetical protein